MTTLLQGGNFAAVPELGYEEWRAVVRSLVGRYNPEGVDPNAFGRVQIRSLFGLGADLFERSPTPAALMTIVTSHKNFVDDSVTRRVPMLEMQGMLRRAKNFERTVALGTLNDRFGST